MPKNKIKCTNQGLMAVSDSGDEGPIAPPIQVEAAVQIEGSDDRFVRLQFRDEHRANVRALIPRADLHCPRTLRRFLLNKGYPVPRDTEQWQQVADFLASSKPGKKLRIINRVGWHDGVFVVPGREFQVKSHSLLFEATGAAHVNDFSGNGTLQGWQSEVAALAASSSRLTFAICCALAAPLLAFTDVESGIFHFEGQSSKGKTTLLIVARSVFGNAERSRLVTWDLTKAGLEELAMGHNHCLLCIDEIARLDGNPGKAIKLARDAAFTLAGGKGRIRSVVYGQRVGKPREAEWRLLCLSNGETAINDMALSAKVTRLLGEQARLIDVPAIGHPRLGIFDRLPDRFDTPAELAEALEDACQRHHGVALEAWTTYLSGMTGTIGARITNLMDQFFSMAGVPQEMGWERRFAKRFALIHASGILGIEAGILPWEPALVAQSINACYRAARSRVPDAEALIDEGWRNLSRNLKGEKIVRLNENPPDPELVSVCDGFWRADQGKGFFFVKPPAFEKWFRSELQAHLVLQRLESRKLLITPTSHHTRTCQVRIAGLPEKRRYYKIRDPKPLPAAKPKPALRLKTR